MERISESPIDALTTLTAFRANPGLLDASNISSPETVSCPESLPMFLGVIIANSNYFPDLPINDSGYDQARNDPSYKNIIN